MLTFEVTLDVKKYVQNFHKTYGVKTVRYINEMNIIGERS